MKTTKSTVTKGVVSTTKAKVTQGGVPTTKGRNPKCKTTFNGKGVYDQKLKNCLCWWGWTGPGARYISKGPLKNRIVADFCDPKCHYTHHVR